MKFVYTLCRGDISKKKEILQMTFISVMNWKAFEMENKNIKEYYDGN